MSELLGISWIKLHDGKLDDFHQLCARCMEVVRTQDTGTLQFEIYLNDDQSECVVVERYKDSEALMEHGRNLGELGEAILALGVVTGACLGEPTEELRALLAGGAVQPFSPYMAL